MKKVIPMILILCLLLCGCGTKAPAETTAPTTEATEAPTTVPPTTEMPTEAPTEAPTETPTEAPTEPPAPTNPLTGETLEAPQETRAFAVSINNVPGAMPMYGVSGADLFFEMFVNDYCTRGLALFGDISRVSAVGSVRSLRYNFIDLCQSYDAIMAYVGASNQVMNDLHNSGVASVNVENEGTGYYFRDQDRLNQGYGWEHCLFIKGPDIQTYAESKGLRITRNPEQDYGLLFGVDTTQEGEDALKITINLTHDGITKQSILEYNPDTGRYLFRQHGQAMYDPAEERDITFRNVIVMLCKVYNEGVYHVAELVGSGEGFFACDGKIIPIRWVHEAMDEPIRFTLTDGTPLELGVGSSYIALAPLTSTVKYE